MPAASTKWLRPQLDRAPLADDRAEHPETMCAPNYPAEMLLFVTYADDIDVYEHGIVVPGGEQPPAGMRVLATTRLPIYSEFSLTMADRDGSSLNERAQLALEILGPHTVADYYEESDVRFFLRESLYHLNKITDEYVRWCRVFEDIHPFRDGRTKSGNTGNPAVLFEVDAYLGAARRVYEAISKVLWKHYNASPDGKGRWSSMRKTVAAIKSNSTRVPAQFATSLVSSWESYGVKLADYRNFVAHTGPLATNGVCWIRAFDGRWGGTVKLLENPENKKRIPARPEAGVDALGYCHEVAAHLVKLSEDLTALPEIGDYLANPPGYGGRLRRGRPPS